mgnify:CR=1 FL=1
MDSEYFRYHRSSAMSIPPQEIKLFLWLIIWIQPGMLTLRYEPTQRDMFTVNLKRSHGEGMRAAQNRRLDAPMFPRNLSHQATLKKEKNQKADLVVHHEHKH